MDTRIDMYKEITCCRVCAASDLVTVLSLGRQALTGTFPKHKDDSVSRGPLDLLWCSHCGLLQLKQSYNPLEMYGENYGYRSGLNADMVRHLQRKIAMLERMAKPGKHEYVLDIGSNDATSLKAYSAPCVRVGIDPTGNKFRQFYDKDIHLVPDFFSAAAFSAAFPGAQCKIITSIAMFYDLESPLAFVKDITALLADDGIWHFEQSYMPSMLRTNAYDTICHEHLEFYSFSVVKYILESCGLRIVDVQTNAVNGGSFAVTACKDAAPYRSNLPVINWLLKQEKNMGLDTPRPYRDFETRVFQHRNDLKELLASLVADKKTILGYGASTKGNVLLQLCGIGPSQLQYIAEVNEEKFGSFTPGTLIPIISEQEAFAMKPDYFLVLPWHFRYGILEKHQQFLAEGGKFIFPLPEIEII